MANKKITDLTVQASVNNTDTYLVVNTTDTSQDPAGSSYKITWATIKAAILGYFSAGTGITFTAGVIASDPTATQTLSNKTLTTPVITTPTINVGSDASGDLHYRSAGGGLSRIPLGSNGQYLSSNGTTPVWGTPAAPTGSISMYGGSVAPTNWLLCDGSAVSRATYANLFTVLSTTYGPGDGSTTFNVPDMRGRVAVGVGTGTGGGSSGTGLPTGGSALTAVARGGWKGEETHILLTAEMPSHTHNITANINSGSGSIVSSTASGSASGTPTTGSTGGDGAHNNIQPIMGLNFIIAI